MFVTCDYGFGVGFILCLVMVGLVQDLVVWGGGVGVGWLFIMLYLLFMFYLRFVMFVLTVLIAGCFVVFVFGFVCWLVVCLLVLQVVWVIQRWFSLFIIIVLYGFSY